MYAPAKTGILDTASDIVTHKVPSLIKGLDYGNIARMAAYAGVAILGFKTLKMLIYGELATATLNKAKDLIASKRAA